MSFGSFMISCAQAPRRPGVTRGQAAPPFVDLLDVDGVVDVHVLEQVEKEERDVRVRARRDVGHRRHTGNAGVQLTEVEISSLLSNFMYGLRFGLNTRGWPPSHESK